MGGLRQRLGEVDLSDHPRAASCQARRSAAGAGCVVWRPRRRASASPGRVRQVATRWKSDPGPKRSRSPEYGCAPSANRIANLVGAPVAARASILRSPLAVEQTDRRAESRARIARSSGTLTATNNTAAPAREAPWPATGGHCRREEQRQRGHGDRSRPQPSPPARAAWRRRASRSASRRRYSASGGGIVKGVLIPAPGAAALPGRWRGCV
jgi:hypothetical protein